MADPLPWFSELTAYQRGLEWSTAVLPRGRHGSRVQRARRRFHARRPRPAPTLRYLAWWPEPSSPATPVIPEHWAPIGCTTQDVLEGGGRRG